jgi:hypothetical protein
LRPLLFIHDLLVFAFFQIFVFAPVAALMAGMQETGLGRSSFSMSSFLPALPSICGRHVEVE